MQRQMKVKGSVSKKILPPMLVLTSVTTFPAQHHLLLPTFRIGDGEDLKYGILYLSFCSEGQEHTFGRASKVKDHDNDQ